MNEGEIGLCRVITGNRHHRGQTRTTMSVSKALASSRLPDSNVPRSFSPRQRRLRHRIPRTVVAPSSTDGGVSLFTLCLVAGIALVLALLACSLIVTGLAVWVANGATEWLAAAVPALLAVLLFGFALHMARLLRPR